MKISPEKYRLNFMNTTDQSYKLTTRGFNMHSEISIQGYRNFFGGCWVDILRMYQKFELLYDYICFEYKIFIENTGSHNLSRFCSIHPFITYDLIKSIGIDLIMECCNVTKQRYTEEQLKNNFNLLKENLKRIPLYAEFLQYSKISLPTYFDAFNIKPENYNLLIKILSSNNEYLDYKNNRSIHKNRLGVANGSLSAIYNDKDYELEFNRIFSYCIETYGTVPPRRLFNKISKFDDSMYRKKYKVSWSEICSRYGFKPVSKYRSEIIVLNTIRNITSIDYTPQKTWDWLIGVGGKRMYCDGYFQSTNTSFVVEFDGVQHRRPVNDFGGTKSFIRIQQNDKLKDQHLFNHGIKIIRIDSREKWHCQEYLTNKLESNGIWTSKTNK